MKPTNTTTKQRVFPDISTLAPHQIELLSNRHRYMTVVWHRRARKTTTSIIKLVLEAINPANPGKVYWHVFPTFVEAKDAVWKDPQMLFSIIPEDQIAKTNEAELSVYFKNGSVLSLKSADNPDRLRGAGPSGVVLDEYAMMKNDVWEEILFPIVNANSGFAWFVSTPKGRNDLHKKYLKGQQDGGDWDSTLLKSSTSGVLTPEQIQNARDGMSEAQFLQEYECDFLEGEGNVFHQVKSIATAEPHAPVVGHQYVVGLDLAQVKDYTAVVVVDRATNAQVYQDRFRTLDYVYQVKKIKEVVNHFNGALVVMDSTGVGRPIHNFLNREGIAIIPYAFTSNSKRNLIEKLALWIDHRKIKILPNKDMIDELESFGYTLTPQGNVHYEGQSSHDDLVCALSLAVWDLTDLYATNPKSRELTRLESLKQDLYSKKKVDYQDFESDLFEEWSMDL